MDLSSIPCDQKQKNLRPPPHLGVIDSCGGNLTSLTEALRRLDMNVRLTISSDPEKLSSADGLILPGVGAARETMERLAKAGLVGFLKEWEKPLLGICIGMQILFSESEEGMSSEGFEDTETSVPSKQPPVLLLGKIPGRIRKIRGSAAYPVPHMGFNDITWDLSIQRPLSLALGLEKSEASAPCFYFVHSYCAPAGPWVVATADYGQKIPALIQWNRCYGVQFHPEKSQKTGLQLLRNYVNLCVSSQP